MAKQANAKKPAPKKAAPVKKAAAKPAAKPAAKGGKKPINKGGNPATGVKGVKAPPKVQKVTKKPASTVSKKQQEVEKQQKIEDDEEKQQELENKKQNKQQPKQIQSEKKIEKVQKTIKKDKSKTEKATKKGKAQRFKDAQTKSSPEDNKCILYVGHLPHGLLEDQLKQYFTQYGTVKGIKVGRSRKTARSKGFGFVRFEIPEIAEIAAKAMNGYMILGKILEVHVLKPEQANPFNFDSGKKQYKFINWSKKFIEEKNADKTPEQTKKEVQNLITSEESKRKRLADLGITYEFPGFQSLVTEPSKKAQKK